MIQLSESEDRVAEYIAMFDDLSRKTDDLIKMDDDYTFHNPYFEIDIHGFEDWCTEWLGNLSFITRGDEKEVVFPTIRDCVIEIKQL